MAYIRHPNIEVIAMATRFQNSNNGIGPDALPDTPN
jgi:hypothetical protein